MRPNESDRPRTATPEGGRGAVEVRSSLARRMAYRACRGAIRCVRWLVDRLLAAYLAVPKYGFTEEMTEGHGVNCPCEECHGKRMEWSAW